ncbi:hypothetical protein [Paraburkholderia sp. BCC1885]|uniref:hypothetical protein n=1 Tax=Paraburkholderia sp. BCC1885 TaxID=2562669 RepID=UPI0011827F67|nr:hypothetical protein [Paraburkholderia sp. BCC1885]
MLTREQILAADDLKSEEVEVPEWGGSVKVSVMSGVDRDAFNESMQASDKSIGYFQSSLLVSTVIDDGGQRVFTMADIDALRLKSAAAVTRVVKVAERLNGFGTDAVEAAEKNSEAAQSGSFGSDSPAN